MDIAPHRTIEADIIRMKTSRFIPKPRQQSRFVGILDQSDSLPAEDHSADEAAAFRGLPFQRRLTVFLFAHWHSRIPIQLSFGGMCVRCNKIGHSDWAAWRGQHFGRGGNTVTHGRDEDGWTFDHQVATPSE